MLTTVTLLSALRRSLSGSGQRAEGGASGAGLRMYIYREMDSRVYNQKPCTGRSPSENRTEPEMRLASLRERDSGPCESREVESSSRGEAKK